MGDFHIFDRPFMISPHKISLKESFPKFAETDWCHSPKMFADNFYRDGMLWLQVLRGCSSWASANGAVQRVFLTPTRIMFAEKFEKCERFLALLWEYFFFTTLSEFRFFEGNGIVKWETFVASFLFGLILSARKSKIKK